MPAAAALKGIIISISIITALGVAVLENPPIQAWLEQQRQKLAELLRQIGEELDPQSRRAAEAFAFEGQTAADDAGLEREASGSLEAAAIATGRSLSNTSTIRRIPVRGPSDPDEAEDRRRKGREYLAQRNQQMYELKERRKAAKAAGASTPPTPTSFDAIVDDYGKLKEGDLGKGKQRETELASLDSALENVKSSVRGVEKTPLQPLLIAESSSSASAWQLGPLLANPFSDEYDIDRSETPKPPVPPKVAIEEEEEEPRTPTMPGSFASQLQPAASSEHASGTTDELTYEEQLAIALSLSEAEAEKAAKFAARHIQPHHDDPELRAAIEASLKEMSDHVAPQRNLANSQRLIDVSQPLVDLSPPVPTRPLHQPTPRGHWETLFDQDYSPTREPLTLASPRPISDADDDDELYRVTPQLTHARLADLNSLQSSAPAVDNTTYDPVREAAELQQLQAAMEASFYSGTSSAPSPATTRTMPHNEGIEQLIDVSEPAAFEPIAGARTNLSRSSLSFHTDRESDSDSETFASISAPPSRRADSRARSEVSNVEVVDLGDESDVDMLSEEGDGIATPDSWTEVGSRDGESEVGEDEVGWRVGGV